MAAQSYTGQFLVNFRMVSYNRRETVKQFLPVGEEKLIFLSKCISANKL